MAHYDSTVIDKFHDNFEQYFVIGLSDASEKTRKNVRKAFNKYNLIFSQRAS